MQKRYYLTKAVGYKGINTFPKIISPKVNVITWLEFELAYFEAAVQHFTHYTTRIQPCFHFRILLFVSSKLY